MKSSWLDTLEVSSSFGTRTGKTRANVVMPQVHSRHWCSARFLTVLAYLDFAPMPYTGCCGRSSRTRNSRIPKHAATCGINSAVSLLSPQMTVLLERTNIRVTGVNVPIKLLLAIDAVGAEGSPRTGVLGLMKWAPSRFKKLSFCLKELPRSKQRSRHHQMKSM